jgi:hypothetical protein
VDVVKADVSEGPSSYIIRVTRIGDLGTNLRRLLFTENIVSSSPIVVTLMVETVGSSETSVITRLYKILKNRIQLE